MSKYSVFLLLNKRLTETAALRGGTQDTIEDHGLDLTFLLRKRYLAINSCNGKMPFNP